MMNAVPPLEAPFRDRFDRLVFRGDRVRHTADGTEYIVNNVLGGGLLDAVRYVDGRRVMCAMSPSETEIVL